jgi:hypothetical protein
MAAIPGTSKNGGDGRERFFAFLLAGGGTFFFILLFGVMAVSMKNASKHQSGVTHSEMAERALPEAGSKQERRQEEVPSQRESQEVQAVAESLEAAKAYWSRQDIEAVVQRMNVLRDTAPILPRETLDQLHEIAPEEFVDGMPMNVRVLHGEVVAKCQDAIAEESSRENARVLAAGALRRKVGVASVVLVVSIILVGHCVLWFKYRASAERLQARLRALATERSRLNFLIRVAD